MTWISDTAPELTREQFVLASMKSIASWPNATAEAVCKAALDASDTWQRGRLVSFAASDGMPLSQRNALLKALFEVE